MEIKTVTRTERTGEIQIGSVKLTYWRYNMDRRGGASLTDENNSSAISLPHTPELLRQLANEILALADMEQDNG